MSGSVGEKSAPIFMREVGRNYFQGGLSGLCAFSPHIYSVVRFACSRRVRGRERKIDGRKWELPPVGAQIENFSHGTSASLPSCRAIEGHARARRSSLKRRNCSPGVVVVAHSGRVSDSAREHCQVKAKSGDPAPAPYTRHARLWNEASTVARSIGRRPEAVSR